MPLRPALQRSVRRHARGCGRIDSLDRPHRQVVQQGACQPQDPLGAVAALQRAPDAILERPPWSAPPWSAR